MSEISRHRVDNLLAQVKHSELKRLTGLCKEVIDGFVNIYARGSYDAKASGGEAKAAFALLLEYPAMQGKNKKAIRYTVSDYLFRVAKRYNK